MRVMIIHEVPVTTLLPSCLALSSKLVFSSEIEIIHVWLRYCCPGGSVRATEPISSAMPLTYSICRRVHDNFASIRMDEFIIYKPGPSLLLDIEVKVALFNSFVMCTFS